jgi:hypothetical protein
MRTEGIADLPTWGTEPVAEPDPAVWDYQTLSGHARHDIVEIRPLLEEVLEPDVLARLIEDCQGGPPRLDDDLWVRIVHAFVAAPRPGRPPVEHLGDMFVPLYLWRASAFMSCTAPESLAVVQARLDSLCETFKRLKPVLVTSWSVEV